MTPAETPTECDCDWCCGNGGIDPFEACAHDSPIPHTIHGSHVTEKDARIHELVGIVTDTRAFFTMIHLSDIRRDLFLKACKLDERAEAALARSEGGSK